MSEKQLIKEVEKINESRTNNESVNQTQPEVIKSESALSLVERAENTINKMRLENDRHEALIIREEEVRAKQMLGGRSMAGQPNVEKSKEQLAHEEANKILHMFR